MSETAEKLKPILASLSAEDRATLIDYMHSLDKNGDAEEELTEEEWEEEWAEEINRRIADFEAGKVKLIPGDEVMRQMKEKYG
ncbi:MAG: addiction module protein [Gemmataceae bacterium]